MNLLRALDAVLTRVIPAVCAVLLAAMVGFTIYTVVMRTVFHAPPFWGDTLTLFANIWLVMLAFALAVREQTSIAVETVYAILPRQIAWGLRIFWLALFATMGAVIGVYGYAAADRILGAFWELGNLPKSYPMMILPVTGAMISIASVLTIIEEIRRARRGGAGYENGGEDPPVRNED